MVRSSFESGRHGSSKKGKKCVLEKPRQPQRSLGVARLEKIRLQNLMMESYFRSSQPPLQSGSIKKEDMRTVHMASAESLALSSITTMPYSGIHPHMMRFREKATRQFRYIGVHSSSPVRFLSKDTEELLLPQSFRGPALALLPLPPQTVEDSVKKHRRQVGCSSNSTGSTSQNSDSSNSQELDLELKL